MNLDKNAFPVNVNLDEAISIFQMELNRKGYKVNITKDNLHLNILPFWVCFYDVDINKDGQYKHYSAQIALNSLTNKLQDEYLKLLDFESPTMIDSLDISFEKVEIRLKKSLVSKDEAKDTITKILSCKFQVDKANVTLSGFEEMYIPIWKCNYEGLELSVDAVVGKINNFDIIKKKEKGVSEAFSEMWSEIKDPKKFFWYLFVIVRDCIRFATKHIIVVIVIAIAVAILVLVL